eukprot:CAMPEP_0196581954 /NCGR_PEP_ID=MMETSP1081-20130531/36644_1 /TAXON_ID=36882 /ORGANISM="Pyramimonas amylifera, Strain CCMP720" /LENGTH=517 /DNA_ID=CAMNT_0041902375 /DNA_START=202 /DNA_END=1755 /DNA_ORIENTATION=+
MDVVVIGGGIGGLCAGALLAMYGKNVTVVESHTIPGGAAHSWKRDGYTFESGPSLYSGMSDRPSINPVGQVLHALDEDLECVYYNTWMMHLPVIGTVITEVGSDQFLQVLEEHVGRDAVDEWVAIKELMKPIAAASTVLPAAAVRSDPAVLLTLGRYIPNLVKVPISDTLQLMKPFSEIIAGKIKHPFILSWMDLLCFLLSGAPASGTLTAEIGFMFDDWYRPNSKLEFPIGGSQAIVNALVRGLTKNGGKLRLGSHVEEVLVEGGRAVGVSLRGGAQILASDAVISTATVWDTMRLLPEGSVPEEWKKKTLDTKDCASFMHLHLGIDAAGLPDDLEIHHIVVDDWSIGVDAPQNVVLVSIASVLDPSLAPKGKHVIHAYTPGSEPYDIWERLDRNSQEYKDLKEKRSQVLWRAVEKAIPDVRQRVEIEMVGTPLTQARFLRRHRGTYGGTGWVGTGEDFIPSPQTPLDGLFLVGDTNFPGPGVPAVAAGGTIAAHNLVPFWKQWGMLNKIEQGSSK